MVAMATATDSTAAEGTNSATKRTMRSTRRRAGAAASGRGRGFGGWGSGEVSAAKAADLEVAGARSAGVAGERDAM